MRELAESSLRAAFDELDRAGVTYSFRKGSGVDLQPGAAGEVDISLEPSQRRAADEALGRASFHRLATPGHGHHRFYLAFAAGKWLKIDAKLTGEPRVPLWLRRLSSRRPAALRRRGPVLAVMGPDGAGKGTVIERLANEIPLEVKVLYLGWRKPGHPLGRPTRDRPPPGALLESAFVLKGWLRGGAILLGGYAAAWRGAIVLCDRHPIEALAVRPRRNRPAAALERLLLSRLTPWPDSVVVLDAPADVLLQRKREHPREVIERWRTAYAAAFDGRGGVVVSSVGPREATAARASAVVWETLSRRRRWPA